MPPMDDRDDYDVGYGKPPKHTRFRKGQSGNPAGKKRPREAPGQIWQRLLQETVTVTENGRKRVMSKLELVLSQMINKAASGNEKHVKFFLEMTSRFPTEASTWSLDRDDEKFLEEYVKTYNALDDEV